MSRKYYPSDISVEQFEWIRGLLEGSKKPTCPRRVDLYEVFCAHLVFTEKCGGMVSLAERFSAGQHGALLLQSMEQSA
jgi:hypothetical protein